MKRHIPLSNLLALLLSLAAFWAAGWVTRHVFEGVPHLEDEVALVWQAKVLATGRLAIPSPEYPKSFLVPFVVDHQGLRFGKYPLGWPLLLAAGIRLGLRAWVNPLLASLAVWLTYRLGKRVFHPGVGLLGAGLMVVSPYFLINSGSLLTHPLGLVLTTAFCLCWLAAWPSPNEAHDSPARSRRRWGFTLLAAILLGALVLTRPWSAVAVSLPFGLHGLYLLWRGGPQIRLRLSAFVLLTALLACLHLTWQAAVTGDPFLNPYTLWWSYDKVGFGPGYGVSEGGHNLEKAWQNTRVSLESGAYDLLGWGRYSWVFLPFGLWVIRRNRRAWLLAGIFASIVCAYAAYWVPSITLGPRYYYESLSSLVLLSAAGIAGLAGWPLQPGNASLHAKGWRKLRPLGITALLTILVSLSLLYYTPQRLQTLYNLYTISLSDLAPFQTPQAQALTPALIVVHSARWMSYSALLELQDPDLTTPFIFIWDIQPEIDQIVIQNYPDRNTYHYYPDQPELAGQFFSTPIPEP